VWASKSSGKKLVTNCRGICSVAKHSVTAVVTKTQNSSRFW